jgi:hypothetical protein
MEPTNQEQEWAYRIFLHGYDDYSVVPVDVLRLVVQHHRYEASKIEALALEIE